MSFDLTFPADYAEETLAGAGVHFAAHVGAAPEGAGRGQIHASSARDRQLRRHGGPAHRCSPAPRSEWPRPGPPMPSPTASSSMPLPTRSCLSRPDAPSTTRLRSATTSCAYAAAKEQPKTRRPQGEIRATAPNSSTAQFAERRRSGSRSSSSSLEDRGGRRDSMLPSATSSPRSMRLLSATRTRSRTPPTSNPNAVGMSHPVDRRGGPASVQSCRRLAGRAPQQQPLPHLEDESSTSLMEAAEGERGASVEPSSSLDWCRQSAGRS